MLQKPVKLLLFIQGDVCTKVLQKPVKLLLFIQGDVCTKVLPIISIIL